jgi:hypothetical protein
MAERMRKRLGPLFWAESVLAFITLFLGVLTIFWDDWIEGILGFDPDHHNGSFEKEIVAVLFLVTFLLQELARRGWRKAKMVNVATA